MLKEIISLIMKGIFNPQISAAIINRIQNLRTASRPVWGKMNVSQMLAHCQVPLMVALNDIKIKRSLVWWLFGGIARKLLVNERPFARNLPTDRSFIIANEGEFEMEKNKLIALVQRFTNGGAAAITKGPHPIFGRMTPEEWSVLSYKHLDHHLRQFGV